MPRHVLHITAQSIGGLMAPHSSIISIPILILSLTTVSILSLLIALTAVKSSLQWSRATSEACKVGAHFSPSADDIHWLKQQIDTNGLQKMNSSFRQGIFPKTREQQLKDLVAYNGIKPYKEKEAINHTVLPCPSEILVEKHHSYYGSPWAAGRDAFEFLAGTMNLSPDSKVIEIGCGSLRVGLHFIRYLNEGNYHCLEKDELSLMAGLNYELPSQGLLSKRPLIVKGNDMDFSRFGSDTMYDLIYANAVFIHMPDELVWTGLERLTTRLKPINGRLFCSHNKNFCARLGEEECTKRLNDIGLEYLKNYTHDSLLFNNYDTWFEFRRFEI